MTEPIRAINEIELTAINIVTLLTQLPSDKANLALIRAREMHEELEQLWCNTANAASLELHQHGTVFKPYK